MDLILSCIHVQNDAHSYYNIGVKYYHVSLILDRLLCIISYTMYLKFESIMDFSYERNKIISYNHEWKTIRLLIYPLYIIFHILLIRICQKCLWGFTTKSYSSCAYYPFPLHHIWAEYQMLSRYFFLPSFILKSYMDIFQY